MPLDSSGLLRLRARASTDLELRVLDEYGQPLATAVAYARQTLNLLWSAPGACIAWVEVREWGNNGWSPWPYTLRAWWEPCDELECLDRNDSLASATPIEPGEILRGSVTPYRDHDYYRVDLSHPGYIEIIGRGPSELTVTIMDGAEQSLAVANTYANQTLRVGADVQAGPTFIRVQEWGDNGQHVGAYELQTKLYRAEPAERRPLAEDPPRRLTPGQAHSFTVDHVKDCDPLPLRRAVSRARAFPFPFARRGEFGRLRRPYGATTGQSQSIREPARTLGTPGAGANPLPSGSDRVGKQCAHHLACLHCRRPGGPAFGGREDHSRL